MKNIISKSVWIFCLSICINACSSDDGFDEEAQLKTDIGKIENYLASKNLEAVKTSSGLHIVTVEEGTGSSPTLSSQVEVKYRGYLISGETFDETDGESTIKFNLGSVIKGWQEGIQTMKRGGKTILLIPSKLGYGQNPPRGIPVNSVLIFDVELVDF
jgi:FKBP-type peptidyl-prolyl cis-trans isomerase FkpA